LNWDQSKYKIENGKMIVKKSSSDALLVLNSASYHTKKPFSVEAQLTLVNPKSSVLFMANYRDGKSDNHGFNLHENEAKA
jgi:hypothetical protein